MSEPEKRYCHFCGSGSYILIRFSDGSDRWKCHDDAGCLSRMAAR